VAILEQWRAARAAAVAAEDQDSVKEWDKQIENTENKLQEMEGTVQEFTASVLEAMRDGFQKTVDLIAEEFEKAVSGMYDNLEDLRSAWDR